MTSPALDAAVRVKTLIALTEELTAIIVQENRLLSERRPQAIAPLQSDKARLAAAYAQSIRDIAIDRTCVSGAREDLVHKLRELTKTFEKRAGEQRALLDGARLATEGVLKSIAKEAAAGEDADRYGAGKTDGARPLVLNQQA